MHAGSVRVEEPRSRGRSRRHRSIEDPGRAALRRANEARAVLKITRESGVGGGPAIDVTWDALQETRGLSACSTWPSATST